MLDSDAQIGKNFDKIWDLIGIKEYDAWKIPSRFYASLDRKQVLWPDTYPSCSPKLLRVDGKVRYFGRLHESFRPRELVGIAVAPDIYYFDRAVKTSKQLDRTHLLYEKIRGIISCES